MSFKIKFTATILFMLGAFSFTGCSDDGNSDSSPDPSQIYAIGDIGPSGVGLVFYVTDGGLHGLEVAPVDQSTSAVWSSITDAYANGVDALPVEIGNGSANTNAIIAQNSGAASAAKICRDYRASEEGDWFLPSKNELDAIWNNLVDNGLGTNSGVGDFDNQYYWSSSEYTNASEARIQLFFDGSSDFDDKSLLYRVRAVRAF